MSREWKSFYVPLYYGSQKDKKKFCVKNFSKVVGECYDSGTLKGIEMALEKVQDPEDRGELHKLLVEAKNSFHVNGLYKMGKTSLEKVVGIYESSK